MIIPIRCFSCGKVQSEHLPSTINCMLLTHSTQVIADLYERYVELIGTPVNEEGDTMPDGYVTCAHMVRT